MKLKFILVRLVLIGLFVFTALTAAGANEFYKGKTSNTERFTVSVKARYEEITLSGVIPAISEGEITRHVEIIPGVKNIVTDFIRLYGEARRSG